MCVIFQFIRQVSKVAKLREGSRREGGAVSKSSFQNRRLEESEGGGFPRRSDSNFQIAGLDHGRSLGGISNSRNPLSRNPAMRVDKVQKSDKIQNLTFQRGLEGMKGNSKVQHKYDFHFPERGAENTETGNEMKRI